MFETFRKEEPKEYNNHNGRSHFGETMQLEGDIRSTGALDLAGLINGNGEYMSHVSLSYNAKKLVISSYAESYADPKYYEYTGNDWVQYASYSGYAKISGSGNSIIIESDGGWSGNLGKGEDGVVM